MATVTYQHSSFNDGQVRIEFEISDANWKMSKVRCINNSDYPAVGRILLSGVEVFTAVAPANQTTSWNTSGVQLGWDTVDGGLMMGNYVMQAQWPGAV